MIMGLKKKKKKRKRFDEIGKIRNDIRYIKHIFKDLCKRTYESSNGHQDIKAIPRRSRVLHVSKIINRK